ncbi:MAG: hypothetical protein AAGF47_09930, partial [Planctomycetota bacterium]
VTLIDWPCMRYLSTGEGRLSIRPISLRRRKRSRHIGGYRAEAYPAEDLDLFLRLSEIGRIDNLPSPVLKYRMHGQSISVTLSDQQRAKMREVCDDAHRRRGISRQHQQAIEAKPVIQPDQFPRDPSCPIAANPTASALAAVATHRPAGSGLTNQGGRS